MESTKVHKSTKLLGQAHGKTRPKLLISYVQVDERPVHAAMPRLRRQKAACLSVSLPIRSAGHKLLREPSGGANQLSKESRT